MNLGGGPDAPGMESVEKYDEMKAERKEGWFNQAAMQQERSQQQTKMGIGRKKLSAF